MTQINKDMIKKTFNIDTILLGLIAVALVLQIIFVFFSYSLSGLESCFIYVILMLIVHLRKNYFSEFFKKLLLISCVITLVSMLLKLDSYFKHEDLVYLLDTTPSIIELIKDSFINDVDAAPKKAPVQYGPQVKPQIVDLWMEGKYRQLAQNLGQGGLKGMGVGGFLITCKPLLTSTKSGKVLVATASAIPIIDHILK